VTLEEIFLFLKKETHADEAASWENYFLPRLERVAAHTCLAPVKVLRVAEDELVLSFVENTSRFREADSVLVNALSTPSRELLRGFQMEWTSCDLERREITLVRSFATRREKIPFQIGEELTIDRMLDSIPLATLEALKNILSISSKKTFLESFLNGRLEDQLAEVDLVASDAVLKAFKLTAIQKEAFLHGITHYPIAAVQGPPGTGKTELLAAFALYYLLRGYEVLVSAVSHYAINNALNRIADAAEKIKLETHAIKVSKNKNSGLSRKVLKISNLRRLDADLKDQVSAYGMTPFKFPYEIDPLRFRVLLLDEASQAHLPFACLAMGYSRKTILLGDHKQMGPILSSENHEKKIARSAFEHCAEIFPERVFSLRETFRLTPRLAKISSDLFYGGKLISLREKEPVATEKNLQDSIWRGDLPGVLVEMSHEYSGKYSEEEAEAISRLIEKCLTEEMFLVEEIAVLVPFRSQQNLIKQKLHSLENKLGRSLKSLLVDTVERMQGQEREVIFYSLAISDPGKLSRIADFYFDPGRFNVALTRARTKRIVLGSPKIFEARPKTPSELKKMNHLAAFWQSEPKVKWEEVKSFY
jgi:DNA replication ATP-dependent helicase Dna2